MQISQKGINLIKQFEGFESQMYKCPAGVLTIGYGHAINQNQERFSTISQKKANELLISDLNHTVSLIKRVVKVPLTQSRFDALCSLIYNWGGAKFTKSLGLKYLNIGDYRKAAIEFFSLDRGVVRIKGEFSQGLYNRRKMEMELWNAI